jgi:hypothetical protein
MLPSACMRPSFSEQVITCSDLISSHPRHSSPSSRPPVPHPLRYSRARSAISQYLLLRLLVSRVHSAIILASTSPGEVKEACCPQIGLNRAAEEGINKAAI